MEYGRKSNKESIMGKLEDIEERLEALSYMMEFFVDKFLKDKKFKYKLDGEEAIGRVIEWNKDRFNILVYYGDENHTKKEMIYMYKRELVPYELSLLEWL